jgi:predicted permease
MFSNLRLGLRAILRRGTSERELDEELRFHVDHQVEKHVASGLSREEATRRARMEFGGIDQVKEEYRDARGIWLLETCFQCVQEVRHACRLLARTPAFTAVAALSLALGIGANSAIFSLHDALLLRPLPVRDPAAVVTVTAASPEDQVLFGNGLSYPNYRDLRERSRSFEGLVADQLLTVSFARSRRAVREMRMGMLVSENFFDVLGVQPVLGRNFRSEEARVPDRDAVAMLGYDFWKNVLAGDPSILGSVVLINGIDFTVIGVEPPSFTGMDQYIRPAFFAPIMMAERLGAAGTAHERPLEDRTARLFDVKGRLKPGVSRAAARTDLARLWKGLEQQYPDANRNRAIAVRSELQQRIRAEPDTAVLIAMMTSLAAIVLIIACANVANLMLGRARARSREIAIRLALGVGRMRLLRQLLTESLLLALIGAALGLGFAYGGIRFLSSTVQTMVPTDLPIVIEPQMDLRVLAFSLVAAVVSAVLFGLAPAWHSLKTQLVPALKSAEPGQTIKQRTIGRNVLVVAQVALSMALLVAAGMLLDGFRKALVANPGFRTDHLLMMSLDTSLVRYTPAQTHDFYRDLVTRARALSGVASVTLASSIPFKAPFSSETVIPEGYQFPPGRENVSLLAAVVDEHYFATMRTGIVRGRAFTADDKDGSRRVAIVNEEFAKTYWPNGDPIGRRVRLIDSHGPWLEVVGLTKTGKYFGIAEAPTPFLYLPYAQNEKARMSLLVETTSADAAPLAAPLGDVVRDLDVNQPVFSIGTFSTVYETRAIGPRLMLMQVTGAMGLVGLTLALVGLYGVVAYSVARRTREIGIRMAIGAGRSDVLKMVLRQGLMLSTAGILVGAVASVAVARVVRSASGGLGAPNPATYVIVPVLLIGLTIAASYFPARRASRVDPLRALRCD